MPDGSGEAENPVCSTLAECSARKARMFCEAIDQENPGPCLDLFAEMKEGQLRPDELNVRLVDLYGLQHVEEAKQVAAQRITEVMTRERAAQPSVEVDEVVGSNEPKAKPAATA